MEIAEVEARPREACGTRACRRLRRNDLVPALIYGRGEPNVLLSVRPGDVAKLLEQHAYIVQVNWDGRQENAQIRQIQYDALGDDILHVDFVRVSLSETVTVSVSVELHGEAAGVAEGGMLEQIEHDLQVECLPTAIPRQLRVEVSQLDIGDSVRIRDVEFPEGVKPMYPPDAVVVTVVQPPEEPEEEAEELLEDEVAEPEVIGRKAEEGPPEEGAEPAGGSSRS